MPVSLGSSAVFSSVAVEAAAVPVLFSGSLLLAWFPVQPVKREITIHIANRNTSTFFMF